MDGRTGMNRGCYRYFSGAQKWRGEGVGGRRAILCGGTYRPGTAGAF